jgi:hypothetical protein
MQAMARMLTRAFLEYSDSDETTDFDSTRGEP